MIWLMMLTRFRFVNTQTIRINYLGAQFVDKDKMKSESDTVKFHIETFYCDQRVTVWSLLFQLSSTFGVFTGTGIAIFCGDDDLHQHAVSALLQY